MMKVWIGSLVFVLIVTNVLCFNELSVIPHKYKLHYKFGNDENLTSYNGSVSIEFKANSDLTWMELDYFGNITDISIRNVNISSDVKSFKYESVGELAEQKYRLENNEVFIHKDQVYEISVDFIGNGYEHHIGLEKTFYKRRNGANSTIVYTDFTQKLNMIFPRFSKIMVSTKYELSITHSHNLMAVSNMPAIRVENMPLVTTKFNETPIIALRSFGFTIGRFVSAQINNNRSFPITIYALPQTSEATYLFVEYIGQIFTAYEKYLKQEIPIPKLDFIVIPELSLVSITNYGLVMCRDTTIQYGLASLKPMLIIPTAGKAIGDHFFMNLYGPIGSQFHWIKDGISSYLTVKMVEIVEPYMENLYKMISYHKSFEIEHTLDNIKLIDTNSRRDVRYTKSAALFRMINHVIGEQKFKTLLQDSLENRIDIIELLPEHFGCEPNFSEFITGWVNQKGYPIVKADRNYTSGEIMLSQKPYGWSNQDSDVTWWIPYNLATKSDPNFDRTKPDGWLNNQTMTISSSVPPNDWIILNKLTTGYFLVNYDEQNWNLIIEELTNGNINKIHPKNRDNLLTTAYLLMTSKEMPDLMFFKLLLYLKQEVNPRPWFVANTILDEIVSRDLTKEYKAQLIEVIHSIFESVYDNYDKNSLLYQLFETTRVIAMKWACYIGYNKCIRDFEKISNLYVQLIEHNQSLFMDAEIRNMMLCYGFQNESDYVKLYDNYQTASYDEMITNRIECHLHTNMFRTKFIRDFIFKHHGDEDVVPLILMSRFQDAVQDLIYEVFEYNFDVFRMEYDKIVEHRLAPFEVINGMLRLFERYHSIPQGDGIRRDKLDDMVLKIHTAFGKEAAEMVVYDLN